MVFFLYQLFLLTFGLYPQVKENVNIFVVEQHVGLKLVLFHRESKSLDIVSLLQNLFLNFV